MNSIYREELMEIYKNPKHKGKISDPSAKVHEENPFCGDEINLQLKVEDDIIKEARFEGAACAVSIISSEKLLEFIEGKTLEEASKVSQDDLLKILDINLSMSRLRCATLVLTALKEAIAEIN